jgi:hypothetical protein
MTRPDAALVGVRAADLIPRYRWREVLLHHVDLGLGGFDVADLPAEYIDLDLPDVLSTVPGRLGAEDRRALMGWITGRANQPAGLGLAGW